MAKDFIKTWNGRRLEDWGSVVSREYKSFQQAMKREVKRIAEENGATLAYYNSGHYYQSGFVERDGMFVYFCYESVDRCKVQLTPDSGWLTPFYMRTAKHAKDFTGGANNNVTFSQFEETMNKLFREQARNRMRDTGFYQLNYTSTQGYKFELILFDMGVHARVYSPSGSLLYHNEAWPGTFNSSYDIYELSRRKMLDETSDIYNVLNEKMQQLKQAA